MTALLTGIAVTTAPLPVSAAPTVSTLDGTTSADAASSCWEIKQLHPSSGDGQYWLRNTSLERPEQFYCDMTTDGGGWVLIARGREGWTFRNYGQNTPQNIRNSPDGTGAFAPGALNTETIDDLLDGGDVKDLTDGVRLRRARNVSGTTWQELRWEFDDLTSWSWAFGGGHRLARWSIDGDEGTGSNTKDSTTKMPGEPGDGNRSGSNRDAWFTFPWSGHGGSAGFSYRGSVGGQNNATSYLWEYNNEDHAIPFTQIFIRPEISTPTLDAIGDLGVAEQVQAPLLNDRPEEIAGGVAGVLKVGDSENQLDTPVLAIATHADRVYVGGKFSDVRNTATGNLEPHAYLAAFDRSTGAWIESFDPELDGTVWDLKVVDNKLIVAGQFTNANGEDLTAGIAALDLTTAAVVPGWRASLELSGSSDRPYARTLDIEGTSIYVGGNFTSVTDAADNERSRGRLARLAISDGNANNLFLPDLDDGVAYDIDVSNGRVHIVGDFAGVNGDESQGVTVVDADDGSTISGLDDPVWTTSNIPRRYQQAVAAVGTDVWLGGSEHNTQAYGEAGYGYLKGYVTSGRGGDTQDFSLNDGTLYQASHANSWIYEDATRWPGLSGYSRTDDYKWVGAFNATTRQYDIGFSPSLDSAFDEGAWALHTDADGCTWFGGDFVGGPFVGGQRQYLEGFSKFCQRDVQAPTVPTNASASLLTAGGVQVNWSASNDDFPGFIGYEVLRNDRVISSLIYGASFVDPIGNADDRYFVRAKDPANNRSASTGVLLPGDNIAPTTPGDLTAVLLGDDSIDVSWTASTDDIGVDSYAVFRNGVEIQSVPSPAVATNLAGLGVGSHWLQVQALDAAGNTSFKTAPVRVDIVGPDVQRPSVPGSPAASYDETTEVITMTWTESVDDTAVDGYRVRRNGAEVAVTDAATLTADLSLGDGDHYLQVEAFDAAGNTSFKTAPVLISVEGPDTERPSTPTNLTAVAAPDESLDVAWTGSSDNVGVVSYRILRNGVEIGLVPEPGTTFNTGVLGIGAHYIQVRAVDAAGNESFKTAPVLVVIEPDDTQAPTTPGNVTAEVQPDGSVVVGWTASTDNVGVVSYRVLRNLNEVALVADPALEATIVGLATGTHFMQVQAVDAAGNDSFRSNPVQIFIP